MIDRDHPSLTSFPGPFSIFRMYGAWERGYRLELGGEFPCGRGLHMHTWFSDIVEAGRVLALLP